MLQTEDQLVELPGSSLPATVVAELELNSVIPPPDKNKEAKAKANYFSNTESCYIAHNMAKVR